MTRNDPRIRRDHRDEWANIDRHPLWPLLWLWSWPQQAWGWFSYTVRPYDMIADCRRWAWQRRAECGSQFMARHPELLEQLQRAVDNREVTE